MSKIAQRFFFLSMHSAFDVLAWHLYLMRIIYPYYYTYIYIYLGSIFLTTSSMLTLPTTFWTIEHALSASDIGGASAVTVRLSEVADAIIVSLAGRGLLPAHPISRRVYGLCGYSIYYNNRRADSPETSKLYNVQCTTMSGCSLRRSSRCSLVDWWTSSAVVNPRVPALYI